MAIHTIFDTRNLFRLEALLLEHPIAKKYFQGKLYDSLGAPLTELTITRDLDVPFQMNAVTVGRLFMIPDGSMVTAARVQEFADTPAGIDIRSHNIFLASDERNSVVVYRAAEGPAMWIDALYVRSILLARQAPRRLISVAFGFMAITAYRLGFTGISLLGAGRGPLPAADTDAMVGYAVWPKFGFDAPVAPVELDRFPNSALYRTTTIQDVRKAAPGWWEDHGSGRTMYFDLAGCSRSWSILLNYLYTALQEDAS